MRKDANNESDKSTENIRYYRDFNQDFVETTDQAHGIPASYKWHHTNLLYRFCAVFVYAAAVVFSYIYTIFVLHIKIENRRAFGKCKGEGIFLYGNHTLPMGDAFAPARYIFPRRLYTVVSAANLGIPVLGKLLPMIGALVVPENPGDMKKLMNAMEYHLKHKRVIIIFPEAHQWPYCSFIRPFEETSFDFPVRFDAPTFCMTTTFQRRRHGDKPKITTYIDGPFYPDQTLGKKKAKKKLHDEVYECMKKRSENTTYEYIRYVKE